MNQLDRVTIAGRVFCIAAVLGLTFLTRDNQALVSLIVIGTFASAAVYISLVTTIPMTWVVTVEALVTGLVIALAVPGGLVLLPYLVVLSLIAGISRGLAGLSMAMAAELAAVVLLPLGIPDLPTLQQRSDVPAPWFLTSAGAGLLGAWLRQIGRTPGQREADASYENARRLLGQFRTVARRLSAGLDLVGMSSQVLAAVAETFESPNSGVFVRTDGGALSPLNYQGDSARDVVRPTDQLVELCWAEMVPCHESYSRAETGSGYLSALPLRVGHRMIGVVLVQSLSIPATDMLSRLMHELDQHSLRLDTALAFDEVRSIATVEERRRLAREIHDGIAQEVASIGYLVDDLASSAESDEQRDGLTALRNELTRVVSELRLSIFDLRGDFVRSSGLGSALSEYVHRVGARSDMTVHLTLDEAPTRLRSEVEAELLRIAQEAITNARKHSQARNLWVDCRVQPPYARLEVRDDGTGLKGGRIDSYGVRIMRERAERVAANLEVTVADPESDAPGTLVRVTLGEDRTSPPTRK